MEALLASPAKESLNSVVAPFYGSVLGTACKFNDQDPETVRMLLKAGADPSKPEPLMPLAVKLRRMTAVLKFFGNVQARGFHKMLAALPARFKQSPTHIAAKKGDMALVKVLAEHENFPDAARKADTKGRTPLAVVVGDAPKAAIADIRAGGGGGAGQQDRAGALSLSISVLRSPLLFCPASPMESRLHG